MQLAKQYDKKAFL